MTGTPSAPPSPFGPVPLTPTAFLDRAAAAFADRTAVVDGDAALHLRASCATAAERLAGALPSSASSPATGVSVLAPNTPRAAGGPLRRAAAPARCSARSTPGSSAGELAYIVGHADAAVLIIDHELVDASVATAAARPGSTRVVAGGPTTSTSRCSPAPRPLRVARRRRAGAALAQLHERHDRPPQGRHVPPPRRLPAGAGDGGPHAGSTPRSVYLWTLPMFHCNGWCFPWAVTAAGGDARLPAARSTRQRIWRADPRRGRHPPQRRADGADR